jgi:hypothetical protein
MGHPLLPSGLTHQLYKMATPGDGTTWTILF